MTEPTAREQAIEQAWVQAQDDCAMSDDVQDYKDFFIAGFTAGSVVLADVEHERDVALAIIDSLEQQLEPFIS